MTKKFSLKVTAGLFALLLTLGSSNVDKPVMAKASADSETSSSTTYLSDDYEFLLEVNALPDLDNHWSKELFMWGINSRIVHGYGDGSYRPDRPVSEAELLKMLFKLMKYGDSGDGDSNWAEGAYILATYKNLPAKGISQPTEKFKAVNRQTAAEIIAGITGVHYSGVNAIRYLIGNQLIPVELNPSLEKFDGKASLTRAEALAWLRVISLKGYTSIKSRPQEPSDPLLLQKLPPLKPIPNSEYFTYFPVEISDLYPYSHNNRSKAAIMLGMKKTEADRLLGLTSDDQDMFNYFDYGRIKVGFDKNGLMDRWKADKHEDESLSPFLTSRGIQPGKSSLSDVMEQYGTGGYWGNEILEYAYEMDSKGVLQPVTDRRLIRHNANGYILSFIFDQDTKIVWYVSIMTYKYVYYDFNELF